MCFGHSQLTELIISVSRTAAVVSCSAGLTSPCLLAAHSAESSTMRQHFCQDRVAQRHCTIPMCMSGACLKGCRVPEVCLYLCLKPGQLHHHRAKSAQLCQGRVKMLLLVWALPLFRSENQQVLTHQVPCLFHAANAVFFVFLLLSIGR